MRLLLITGSIPPNVCGVGDYTYKLYTHLINQKDIQVELYYKQFWSLKYLLKYFRELKNKRVDIYHFQYPTEGYGYSLLPLLLLLLLLNKKTIVTIHELSSRNFLALLYTLILMLIAKKVILTNNFEKLFATKLFVKKSKITVIEIASNIIESLDSGRDIRDRKFDLAYFGHIRPLKGIEDFLSTVSKLGKDYRVIIIGQKLDNYLDFFNYVQKKSIELKIELIIGENENKVANLLANVKTVYLPYPDGISIRRGTLLACINNSCVIISKPSKDLLTNDFFNEYCYLTNSNSEASLLINEILNLSIPIKNILKLKTLFSWSTLINKHLKLYKTTLNI
jgi:glycosyltransferase involved in cell wall biosynthesis